MNIPESDRKWDLGRPHLLSAARVSEQLDPEQREQLLAALRERKRRAGAADRPVLLWAGDEVVTPKLSRGERAVPGEPQGFLRGDLCGVWCAGGDDHFNSCPLMQVRLSSRPF